MKKVLQTLQSLIKTEIANQISGGTGPLIGIKKVYFGDPIQIPEVDLPAISLAPKQTAYIQRGTRYDTKQFYFEIRVIENKKAFYNKSNPNQEKVDIVESMIDKAETISGNEVLGTSICGLVEKNTCLRSSGVPVAEVLKVENVNYSFNENRGFPTYESIISCNCLLVGNR